MSYIIVMHIDTPCHEPVYHALALANPLNYDINLKSMLHFLQMVSIIPVIHVYFRKFSELLPPKFYTLTDVLTTFLININLKLLSLGNAEQN